MALFFSCQDACKVAHSHLYWLEQKPMITEISPAIFPFLRVTRRILKRLFYLDMCYAKGGNEGMFMSEEEKSLVTLRLPSTLSAYSGGKSQITLRANTVAQLFSILEQQHPQIWAHLCTEQGYVREHVRIFVNNKLITGQQGLQTSLHPGQEIIVLPASPGR
jgi:molybdopterin converting factor small subunit